MSTVSRNPVRGNRGVTLVMVTGVLAILAAMAAGFYTLMVSESRSATGYDDMSHANMLAKAGIADAVARLQEQAYFKTEDPTDAWFTTDYLNGAAKKVSFAARVPKPAVGQDQFQSFSRSLANRVDDSSDRYTLNVSDASGKINVNAGDNLGVLLDNLCRVLGPPLVPADLDALQPRCWALLGANDPALRFANPNNSDDLPGNYNLYYRLGLDKNPIDGTDGRAKYGDGYAIAGARGRLGRFQRLEDVKNVLTVGTNPDYFKHPELMELEREAKFNVLKDYITIDSWVDVDTVCVGKFEYASEYYLIDRDKSFISSVDDNGKHIDDPYNQRGTLCGSYVSIINGHGAGQMRVIKENGIDWIQVDEPMTIAPGPISSYMIVAKEPAKIDPVTKLPLLDMTGHPIADPKINYKQYPLCIHRAPVNVNTASDKVLTAVFMGLNVQHGTPLSVGTESNVKATLSKWFASNALFHRITQLAGLKRLPTATGKPILDRKDPWTDNTKFGYINNQDTLTGPDFIQGGGKCNEAHDLAYRVICARQCPVDPKTGVVNRTYLEPLSNRYAGPFKSWDDFYFRVVRPWDTERVQGTTSNPNINNDKLWLSNIIMANCNSNTDILKFNPNIEWIDRWGRNFHQMEPIFDFDSAGSIKTANKLYVSDDPAFPQTLADPLYPKNIPLPTGTYYYMRGMRYRFDDLIDKTDLNRSTTEFCFNGGGIYEIQSTGQTVRNGVVLAERKAEALVKVYEVWRESNQSEFVEGYISNANRKMHNVADKGDANFTPSTVVSAGFMDGGRITRDSSNLSAYKALDTLPEPLVPYKYELGMGLQPPAPPSWKLVEHVDTGIYAADGKTPKRRPTTPDVIANHVLPARWDGQLVLATNTNVLDTNPAAHSDTFLASFNGDLDSDTCVGNGREQAKSPVAVGGMIFRNCDTIGLLGYLNDTQVDLDPDYIPVFAMNANDKTSTKMGSLENVYWNNLTGRVGDLRAEGVFLGCGGTSCKDGTLKYPMCSAGNAGGDLRSIANGKNTITFGTDSKATIGGGGPATQLRYDNYALGTPPYNATTFGTTVTMWFKPNWHATDHIEHEFFNGGCNGQYQASRMHRLVKNGYLRGFIYKDASGQNRPVGTDFMDGDLWTGTEGYYDSGLFVGLHGGHTKIQVSQEAKQPPNLMAETPSYYCQPFRWGYVGMVTSFSGKAKIPMGRTTDWDPVANKGQNFNYYAFTHVNKDMTQYPAIAVTYTIGKDDAFGFHRDLKFSSNVDAICGEITRPFINTARHPEGQRPNSGQTGKYPEMSVECTLQPEYLNNIEDPTVTYAQCTSKVATPYPAGVAEFKAQWIKNLEGTDRWLPDCTLGPRFDIDGQPAAYSWAFHPTNDFQRGCFSISNQNQGNAPKPMPGIPLPPPPRPPYVPTGTGPPPTKPYPPAMPLPPITRDLQGPKTGMMLDLKLPYKSVFDSKEPVYVADGSDTPTASGAGAPAADAQPVNVPAGNGPFCHLYRMEPASGTYAVIDELKLSAKKWTEYQIANEMTCSRYYLPADPGQQGQLPTFTSQSLLQWAYGYQATSSTEMVRPARVTWTVFTPRFMHEYKMITKPGTNQPRPHQQRTEIIDGQAKRVGFRGPFNYPWYNHEIDTGDNDAENGWKSNGYLNRPQDPEQDWFGVRRPSPQDNIQPHYSKGVEVELVQFSGSDSSAASQARPIAGFTRTGTKAFSKVTTFVDPEADNIFHDPASATAHVSVKTSDLHYLVRFKYPVSPDVDKDALKKNVDPDTQYLLDTPVFDDISIIYVTSPKFMYYREVLE